MGRSTGKLDLYVMREILFRGKTEQGDWVYGTYHPFEIEMVEEDCADPFYSTTAPYHSKKEEGAAIIPLPLEEEIAELEFISVVPETVGQYTGAKDSEDNKIFEGDILQPKLTHCPVLWAVDWSQWRCTFSRGNFPLQERELGGVKIIGNIHDNPELLDKEKNK